MPSSSSTRLFVGNLAESLDEYALVHFLSKHGKISKFDYLFHKAGPMKGRPRGYAFVEYATPEEAMRTMLELNDKLLMGRRVAIKKANEAPQYDQTPQARGSGSGPWRNNTTVNRTTTLSLLKGHTKPQSDSAKINALEAKLARMEAEKQASESEREMSVEAGPEHNQAESSNSNVPSKTGGLPKTLPIPASANLPKRPTADTIATAERLEEVNSKRENSGSLRNKARETQKETLSAKATLATLGASLNQ